MKMGKSHDKSIVLLQYNFLPPYYMKLHLQLLSGGKSSFIAAAPTLRMLQTEIHDLITKT